MNPTDPIDDVLAGAAELKRVYRDTPRDEPPAALDNAIRAAARRAVQAGPRSGASWVRRWQAPMAIAATVVVTISVTLILGEYDKPQAVPGPSLARDDQPAAAPAPADAFPAAPAAAPQVAPQVAPQAAPAHEPMRAAETSANSAPPAQPRPPASRGEPALDKLADAPHAPEGIALPASKAKQMVPAQSTSAELPAHKLPETGALGRASANVKEADSRSDTTTPAAPPPMVALPPTSVAPDAMPPRKRENLELRTAEEAKPATSAPSTTMQDAGERKETLATKTELRPSAGMNSADQTTPDPERQGGASTAGRLSSRAKIAAPAASKPDPLSPPREQQAATAGGTAESAIEARFNNVRVWFDYIRRLRAAGRESDARASLERLRKRYPDEPLPADLRF